MAYQPNVPQPSDIIAQSQIDFITNFQQINSQYGLNGDNNLNVGDHVELNETEDSNVGAHKKLSLVQQASDPALSSTELAAFAKNSGSQSELFYKRFGDSTAGQLTGRGGLSNNGLVLRAFVCFDGNGNIITTRREDQSGDPVDVPLQFNIASITKNQVVGGVVFSDFTLNFTNALPTANYFWLVQSFNNDLSGNPGQFRYSYMQPYNTGTYGSAVTTTTFRLAGYWLASGATTPSFGSNLRIQFQAYTVG